MKTTLLLLALLTSLVAAAAAQGGSVSHPQREAAGCTSGPTTVAGSRAYRYCGTASAVVKISGRTIVYRGGSCRRTPTSLELNIGTAILGLDPDTLPRYFGIGVGRIFGVGRPAPKDGSYSGSTIAFVEGNKRWTTMQSQVVLRGDRTLGSFSGKLLGGGAISGTFRCAA